MSEIERLSLKTALNRVNERCADLSPTGRSLRFSMAVKYGGQPASTAERVLSTSSRLAPKIFLLEVFHQHDLVHESHECTLVALFWARSIAACIP